MKYWLKSLWRTKNANWHAFPNTLLCRGAVEFLGFGFFYAPSHIAYYAVKMVLLCRGRGLHRSSSLSYHAETLNQWRVKWFERHGWWPESLFFLNLGFHCVNATMQIAWITCNMESKLCKTEILICQVLMLKFCPT